MSLKGTILSIVLIAAASLAHAQGFGDRPVRLVVPYGPGGTSDMVARALQEPLQEKLKRTVLVENKAGATGTIAARFVAGAPADGTVLLVPNSGNTLAPLMQEKQPFDYRTNFAPVSMVADAPMVMVVSGDLPVTNLAEFLAYVKANPGKVAYGAPGVGSFGHLATELLQKTTDTKLYFVPYQNGTQVNLAIAAGEVKMMIISLPDARTAISLGKGVKAIAVTSLEATPLMPGVPAMAETIPGFSVMQHFGVLAPAGTPPDVVRTLGDAIREAMKSEAVRKQYTMLGLVPTGSSSEQLAKVIADDYARWEPIIRSLDLAKN